MNLKLWLFNRARLQSCRKMASLHCFALARDTHLPFHASLSTNGFSAAVSPQTAPASYNAESGSPARTGAPENWFARCQPDGWAVV